MGASDGRDEPVERAAASGDGGVADSPEPAEPGSAAEPRTGDGGLPEQTRDDTDVGWGSDPESMDPHDQWLLEQRPPHWD
jgi:hypothetical protein